MASEISGCTDCDEGWICEEHPDKPFAHDSCRAPGMPCKTCHPSGDYPGIPDGAVILAESSEKPSFPWGPINKEMA